MLLELQSLENPTVILAGNEYEISKVNENHLGKPVIWLTQPNKRFILSVYDQREHLGLLLEITKQGEYVPVTKLIEGESKLVEALIIGSFIEEVTGLGLSA